MEGDCYRVYEPQNHAGGQWIPVAGLPSPAAGPLFAFNEEILLLFPSVFTVTIPV